MKEKSTENGKTATKNQHTNDNSRVARQRQRAQQFCDRLEWIYIYVFSIRCTWTINFNLYTCFLCYTGYHCLRCFHTNLFRMRDTQTHVHQTNKKQRTEKRKRQTSYYMVWSYVVGVQALDHSILESSSLSVYTSRWCVRPRSSRFSSQSHARPVFSCGETKSTTHSIISYGCFFPFIILCIVQSVLYFC